MCQDKLKEIIAPIDKYVTKVGFTDEDYQALGEIAKIEPVKTKGDKLLWKGRMCNGLYFVYEGVLASYYEDKNRSWNNNLYYKYRNPIYTELKCLFSIQPFESPYNVKLLTTSIIYFIHFDDFEALHLKNTKIQKFIHRYIIWKYASLDRGRLYFKHKSGIEKVKALYITRPDLIFKHKLPDSELASLVGLSNVQYGNIKRGRMPIFSGMKKFIKERKAEFDKKSYSDGTAYCFEDWSFKLC